MLDIARMISTQKQVGQADELWAQLYTVVREALVIAKERLSFGAADRVVQTQNKSLAGASRVIDVLIEDFVVKRLSNPQVCVLSEEHGFSNKKRAKYFAILDPIDGTDVALRGMDYYAICLAAGPLDRGRVYLRNIQFAVVCSPIATFHAIRGLGAYQDGERIHTSGTKNLKDAIIRIPKLLTFPTQFVRRAKTLLYLGSTGLEMCFVANGYIDCYFETKRRKVYDYAAASLVVEEAGGSLSTLAFTPLSTKPIGPLSRSTLVAAANPRIVEVMRRELEG
jgi:myo-inositol-1(or 4)-monophosphatase